MKIKPIHLLIFVVFLLMLPACGGGNSPDAVIETYLTALVTGDNAAAVNVSCTAWEANANAEGASFEGVEVALEGMDCRVLSENGETASVACEGDIVFSYAGGEDEVISLNRRDYSLAFEAGEWRMCGYE